MKCQGQVALAQPGGLCGTRRVAEGRAVTAVEHTAPAQLCSREHRLFHSTARAWEGLPRGKEGGDVEREKKMNVGNRNAQESNSSQAQGPTPGSALEVAHQGLEEPSRSRLLPCASAPTELCWISSARDLTGRSSGLHSQTDGLPLGPHLPGNAGAVGLCSAEQNLVYFPLPSLR